VRALVAEDVLRIAERGTGDSPTATALAILACVTDPEHAADLARLPLGARDRLLLEVRERSLGGSLDAVESCPSCDADLEVALRSADLLIGDPPASTALTLELDELSVRFRLPTSEDLLCVEACVHGDEAVRTLAARCIESAARGGREVDRTALVAELGEPQIEALGEAMAAADPQADLTLEMRCAQCGDRFERELDLASFFLEELGGVARRLFTEIHVLARGYGWSEAEILAMSAWRRHAYVEMLAP